MGAAAVCICALLLERDGFCVEYVHAYGSPMFTDATGASIFNRALGTKLLRVAQYEDVVRTMPPRSRGGFQHCGAVVLIHEDDSVWYLPESPAMEPARGVSMSSSKGFNVHRTSQYSLAVGRQIARLLGSKGSPTEVAAAAADADAAAAARIAANIRARDGSSGQLESCDFSTTLSSSFQSVGRSCDADQLSVPHALASDPANSTAVPRDGCRDSGEDLDTEIPMYYK